MDEEVKRLLGEIKGLLENVKVMENAKKTGSGQPQRVTAGDRLVTGDDEIAKLLKNIDKKFSDVLLRLNNPNGPGNKTLYG